MAGPDDRRSGAGDVLPVTVVGAGPYGLAAAAHLRVRGVPFRVFGDPMESWRERMPAGMYLKSTPSASSIADPWGTGTLARFRAAEGREPGGDLHPVPLDEFVRYGSWFQQRLVPALERTRVRRIGASGGAFRVELADGEVLASRSVVMANGLGPFGYVPPELAELVAAGAATHSAEHADLSGFAGQRVAVVGAGQSALESAALLLEAGAEPVLVARTAELAFAAPPTGERPRSRPPLRRLAKPDTTLGPGWSMLAYSRAAGAYRHLPEPVRGHLLRTVLGPSGGWWLRERVIGRVDLLTGHRILSAVPSGPGARLELADRDGAVRVLEADHVLAATGYRVDVDRIELLSPELRAAVRRTGRAPALSAGFESSVPGLYFTGLAAAATFGPVLRFVCGTGFASRRIGVAVAAGG
ncbi:NAD(P)-binding domain-containing protein [Streptacidiphilus albus]|uniref:NAD(P)-binding domain-containing protein n=1 Tax=Streptacidiphilus albus TaxID=105425 RepID=UPI0005A66A9C|nr:NAD(P)-binding domain-containing protein [Streptacidiphilus albus]